MSPARVVDETNLDYDYVICGGGTSGCAIAGRLAEAFPADGPSILIIEAGPDSKGLQLVSMAGGLFEAIGSKLDWNLETVPQKHMNNRVIQLPRGRFLGGSSGFNGTLAIRGTEADYDAWGLEGWTGHDMFRCMRKAETFNNQAWFNAAEGAHGSHGPLQIEPYDPAPISKLVLEAMQEKGFPRIDDVFTTGESAHACGHAMRTVHQGTRTLAADYLRSHESRINIMVSTVVDKVVLERRSNKLVATGVSVLGPSGAVTVKARKEIIISSGSYCSPTILLRSGIGSQSELAEHNISCQLDLPGVGKNLQDHVGAWVPYEVSTPNLTHDSHIHHPGGLEAAMAQYTASKSGFFSSFPFGAFAYARLDDQLASSPLWKPTSTSNTTNGTAPLDPTTRFPSQPHVELMHTELYSGFMHGPHAPLAGPPPGHAFEMMTLLFAQQSHGSVTLTSASPTAAPRIDPRYLSHPLDAAVLAAGARFAHEMLTASKALAPHLRGFLPVLEERFAGLWDGDSSSNDDTADAASGNAKANANANGSWDAYIRAYGGTMHHPAGTCRMGHAGQQASAAAAAAAAEGIVVDERLKVLGVQGLRVADCSVMPRLHGGHTQMVAYGIGERAAEILLEDWKKGGHE